MNTLPAVTAHPLSWPLGRARTPAGRRTRPAFKPPSFAAARDGLLAELKRFGATRVILSTNVSLRRDGLPLAGQRQPEDPGVAVYFDRKGKPHCFACDRWAAVEANLRAVADVVDALRLIERRGTGDMLDAAFAGFAALPPAGEPARPRKWWEVLNVYAHTPADTVNEVYRRLAKERHPDRGGSVGAMQELNRAYDEFKAERGL